MMMRSVDGLGPSVIRQPTVEPEVVQPPEVVAPPVTGFPAASVYQPAVQAPVELTPAQQNAQDAALAKLSPMQQQQFNQVMGSLNGNVEAQTDLRQELLNGKLTGDKDKDGNTLLDHLSTITDTTAPLQGNLDHAQLAADLLHETAHPSSINQGDDNYFCGAAAVSAGLAAQNPAEYGRIVAGLATDGQVTLAGGHHDHKAPITLSLKPGFSGDDGSGRSLTQQLIAQPLTQAATGPDETVDDRGVGHVHDTMTVGHKENGQEVTVGPNHTERGTFGDQVAKMQSAIHGEEYKSAKVPSPGDPDYQTGMDYAKATLRQQVANDTHPAVESGHHWYAVTNIDSKDNVTYVDERGHQKTSSLDDFLSGADSFTYATRFSDPPVALADDGSGGPGGGWNPSSGSNTPGTYTGTSTTGTKTYIP